MKKYIFILLSSTFLLFSCGGLESQVEALAEKECECDSMEGDERRECRKEANEMEKKFKEALDEANPKPSEMEELEKLYKDKKHECDN